MEIYDEKYHAEIIPKTYEGIADNFSELVNFIDSKSKIKIKRLKEDDKLDIELIETPVFSTKFYQKDLKNLLNNIDKSYKENLEEIINKQNNNLKYNNEKVYFSIDFNYYGKEGKYPKVNVMSYFGRLLKDKKSNLYLIASCSDYENPSISIKDDDKYISNIKSKTRLEDYFSKRYN